MFGRKDLGGTGRRIQVLVHEREAIWTPGGMSLDWSLGAALGAETTINDGLVLSAGNKYYRYGQVMAMVTKREVQTITVANATGGTFAASGVNPLTAEAFSILAIPYNVSLVALQALFDTAIGQFNAVVGGAVGAYTITFNGNWGNVDMMVIDDALLTGGGTEAATVAQTTAGVTNYGYYGPYDPNVTDGRQTLERGKCFIMNETWIMDPPKGTPSLGRDSELTYGISGGRVYIRRIIHSGVAVHSLAAGPTLAELYAAFPQIVPVWLEP